MEAGHADPHRDGTLNARELRAVICDTGEWAFIFCCEHNAQHPLAISTSLSRVKYGMSLLGLDPKQAKPALMSRDGLGRVDYGYFIRGVELHVAQRLCHLSGNDFYVHGSQSGCRLQHGEKFFKFKLEDVLVAEGTTNHERFTAYNFAAIVDTHPPLPWENSEVDDKLKRPPSPAVLVSFRPPKEKKDKEEKKEATSE